MEIQGYCDEKFAQVLEVFRTNFNDHLEVGASFAVSLEGEMLVDIWGGYRDAKRTLPWEENTLVNVFSTTKTMTFLCALMLVDRGELDLNAPVAAYWPEFSANGKEGVLVKHLLSHAAGLPGFSRQFTPQQYFDWEFCCTDLAAQAPWWVPGTQFGYHMGTQGYLIGEVVRRISGQSLGQFFKHHVAQPVAADFHIGVAPEDFARIAELVAAPEPLMLPDFDPDSVQGRVFDIGFEISPELVGSPAWRQAEIPAANGHGNARSVVRAQTALANGGRAFGVELLSERGALRAACPQMEGMDLVFGLSMRYAMGYAMPTPDAPVCPNPNALFWAGAGGSTIVVDQDNRLCLSYVMNQQDNMLICTPRGQSLTDAVYAALGS
jgi:CubicO group peptidase (beta-lactamase class C family)